MFRFHPRHFSRTPRVRKHVGKETSLDMMWDELPSPAEPEEASDFHGRVVAEPSSKYFVKRMSRTSSAGGSVLSGDEDLLGDAPRMAPRKRAATAARVQSARAGFGDLVEVSSPTRQTSDLILSRDSAYTLLGVADEFRRGDEIRRHGLNVRSKLLFCGPPGCGKSLCAEVIAAELKMPLVTARLDAIIASHLGETANNLRKMFDAAKARSVVLFLDEFDALARAREDTSEHSEIRRVVNSLLMMIDRFEGNSLLLAATNLEQSVDRAIWRRFDEVVVFDRPGIPQIRRLLNLKTKNFKADFDIAKYADAFAGMSYAQIERTCISAMRTAILAHKKSIGPDLFERALAHEKRRAQVEKSVLA